MSPHADKALFAVTFVALSGLLGCAVWVLGGAIAGRENFLQGMVAVPAVSVMLAARGYSWRRKFAYAGITIVFYVLVGVLAQLSGLYAAADSETGSSQAFLSPLTLIYLTFLTTFPLGMLVLFVGRSPHLLWSRKAD